MGAADGEADGAPLPSVSSRMRSFIQPALTVSLSHTRHRAAGTEATESLSKAESRDLEPPPLGARRCLPVGATPGAAGEQVSALCPLQGPVPPCHCPTPPGEQNCPG